MIIEIHVPTAAKKAISKLSSDIFSTSTLTRRNRPANKYETNTVITRKHTLNVNARVLLSVANRTPIAANAITVMKSPAIRKQLNTVPNKEDVSNFTVSLPLIVFFLAKGILNTIISV